MTVENEKLSISHTGNGSVTSFAYDFLVYLESHMTVKVNDIETTEGWSISGLGEPLGGQVLFDSAPVGSVILERVVPFTQLMDYEAYDAFPAQSHETALDLSAMRDLQMIKRIDDSVSTAERSLRVPEGDAATQPQLTFGSVGSRANKYMAFGADGQVLAVNIDTPEIVQPSVLKAPLITAVTGERVYTIVGQATSAHALYVDGREQRDYTLVDSELTLLFDVFDGQILSVWYDVAGLPIESGDRKGSLGNPFLFDTIFNLVSASASMYTEDWAYTLGETTKCDGKNATYYLVNAEDAGDPDGFYILNLGDKKGILMYQAPDNNSGNDKNPNFPYEYSYPINQQETDEMRSLIADNCIGYGGSTWWVRPCVIGRIEDGKNVIYRGDTYGTAEDREREQGEGEDVTLHTNKRLGEAVIKLTRLVELTSGFEFSHVGLNDKLISHREDEHHQPAVWHNNLNGQLITSWGNRNSSRNQDGSVESNIGLVRYGKDSNTLGSSETQDYGELSGYAQGMFIGSTSFLFKRTDVGAWSFVRGSGGQNYGTPTPFSAAAEAGLAGQFYFAISCVDKSATNDPSSAVNRTIAHFFGNPHPTNNARSDLLYARGTYIPAGSNPADPTRDFGGFYLSKLSNGNALGGATGRMDGTFQEFGLSEMDVAYSPPAGYRTRLLDVQYGDTPRALIAQWQETWQLPQTMPLGTTYDLILIEFDGVSTSTTVIAAGIRGDLGYNKFGSALNVGGTPTGGTGVEGTTYAFGASFYRGKDYTDLEPIVYYCDRVGDDTTQHRLHRVTLDAAHANVLTDEVLISQRNIIYRPEMALGGEKRILFYNEGIGWSSFNSFNAQTKFIDETI